MTVNFATFDIEAWHDANYRRDDDAERPADPRLATNVDRLLELCAAANVKATCFVVGRVARQAPGVVRALHAAGHEIASHSYSHRLVYDMTPTELGLELDRSKQILEDLIGAPVVGFRAPSWSVRAATLEWFYDVLAAHGFIYSSSVFPIRTFLYGIDGFRRDPHHPLVRGAPSSVLEIPSSVVRAGGRALGFAGGFYLRLLPTPVIRAAAALENRRGRPVVVYLHPRELDPDGPRLPLPLLPRFIQYYNLRSAGPKLARLLGSLQFDTMAAFARRFEPAGAASC